MLYEGRTYYLQFPSNDGNTIKRALAVAGIENAVSWNRLNRVATLRVVNRIGLIRLFGKEYDIRSDKFLEGETGLRQFQIILDDLATLSRHILFASNAAPGANRIHSAELNQPSLLERFNYYRQTCFKKEQRPGLAELVDQIVLNPHGLLIDEHVRDHIWNSRKPSRQTLKSLFHHDQSFARLPESHPLAHGRPGLKIVGSEDILFPLNALRSRGSVSINTAENRFVKHVLIDVESVCRSVAHSGLVTGPLLDQCHQLLNLSRSLLRLTFFQDVGRLHGIPFSSPTLGRRHGYRDLYRIFMRCRTGAKHLFEDLAEDALIIELKDVSLLYEYWVFYKVASTLLNPGAVYISRSAIEKDGRIVNAAVVSDGEWRVYFNRTYGRRANGSYSLTFRPDIVIERVSPASIGTPLHILDAKYRNVEDGREVREDSTVNTTLSNQSTDIHKMHCYMDAIHGARTATAVYPGHGFVFYSKDGAASRTNSPKEIGTLAGVGAVPLMPGAQNTDFSEFLALLGDDVS